MVRIRFREKLAALADRESLRPDLGRAVRCTLGLMVPLVAALLGRLPVEAPFAVLTAMNVAMLDIRGAYALRFSVLLSVTLALAGSAGLSGLLAAHFGASLAGMAAIAVMGGMWRQVSNDYGPSVAIASALLYAFGLAEAGGRTLAGHHLLAALAGGGFGLLLQVAFWPFRPEHPLRRSVGDAWLAASDLCAEPPSAGGDAEERHRRLAIAEATLRTALDQAYRELSQAAARRRPVWIERLERLRAEAAQFGLLVAALRTALEAEASRAEFERLSTGYAPLFTALTNLSRTVALAVVSRQPGHLAACEVRLRRCGHLMRVLREALPASDTAGLAEVLAKLESFLPVLGEALRATIGRADERAAFSLELFDLETWKLRPLASALNVRAKIDRALLLHTARIAVLTVIGVVAFKGLHLAHGYWIPFTMAVVLQPDYGSTRQKAAQRMLGTLAGSVLASLMLWLHLPFAALMAATAASSFIFVYLLKRRYALSVVFITLFVVLLTESSGPVRLAFTIERLADTTAGGTLALVAALIFWPMWESGRFPPILARALRGNAEYLRVLASHLSQNRGYGPPIALARRRAEKANAGVFSSLQRMMGDPKARQDRLEEAAALANGNQRLTRSLALVALNLGSEPGPAGPRAGEAAARFAAVLEAMAAAVEVPGAGSERLAEARRALDEAKRIEAAAEAPSGRIKVGILYARVETEIGAMLLAAEAFA